MINRRDVLLGTGALLATRQLVAAGRPLDLAYINAKVWTGQRDVPLAGAIGISGNRVAVVGDSERVRKLASKSTRLVDLRGAFVMPGFIDNHTHFLRASFGLSSPELRTAKTREEFVGRIAEAAKALRPGQWLQGGNWDEQMWGGELPSKQWIDAVTPGTPVAVVRLDQHVALLNSLALKLARIDRNTPDPEGGLIMRDAHGEPTGLIKDKAKNLLDGVIPRPGHADIDAAIGVGTAHALSKGVTQVHVTELDWVTHDSLRRLRQQHKVGMRFYSFVPLEDWRELDALVKAEGRGDDWVRWGGLKGLVDGSLGSRTAVFREPYADDPASHGIYRTPPEKLRELILSADAAGLHITVHAIGDEGNDQVLGMFEAAMRKNGARDRRFRIEHAQHLLASDVPRFARLNVIASMQPYHVIDDGRWAIKPLGPERLHGAWAIRSLLDAKAKVTFGSDWPVAPMDPLLGISAAVLRRTIDGANPSGWVPQERITVQESLTAYTTANAYAGFQEDRLGLIAPGYLADLVILDTDLTRCAPEQIERAKVLSTLVDGQVRFGSDRT
ncbi:amidohydrolase [Steroidobacter sp. S1-65]|uniref:Amidohydrolase n=1 Tax=Steroidobacter gossypii TaxID=2805490 RepID=A0ABS1WTH0_9GAMM|nr:amidohydrolase [Steroidobacter gossypii]MBM0104275.1 amidohydrolase [Steroidobacter gossypii]